MWEEYNVRLNLVVLLHDADHPSRVSIQLIERFYDPLHGMVYVGLHYNVKPLADAAMR